MIFDTACNLKHQGISFCIITLVGVRGSAPQDPGAKCIVSLEGLVDGTVGGGKVEAYAIKRAIALLKTENEEDPVLETWNLQKDIGMTCGGECTFLFEIFSSSSWPIVIFGAGHIAQAVTRSLKDINCQIICIDSRKEWIEKLDSNQFNLKAVHHEDPKILIPSLPAHAYYISMTKGHAVDTPILEKLSRTWPDCPYVGVIGSQSKGVIIKKDLQEMDVPKDFIAKLRVPVGLDLGTNAPAEIAISISAELLQVRDQLSKI